MFPQLRPDTPRAVRKVSSTCFLFISLLFSATVWSQPGPRILHAGLNCILAGENVILEALVEPPDELITIKAYFRADVYTLFYYVEMTQVGDVYQAVLPKPSPQIPGVIYYLEAVDSAFNSARTAEFHPEVVVDQSSCRETNPTPPAYFEGPANITVGATGEGASFPPGFLTEGIVGTIAATGRVVATGGAGVGTAVAVAAAGGAAVGVGLLATGGDNKHDDDLGWFSWRWNELRYDLRAGDDHEPSRVDRDGVLRYEPGSADNSSRRDGTIRCLLHAAGPHRDRDLCLELQRWSREPRRARRLTRL